ncbi:MAG: HD domain-containing protein [Betaproteobacteria bacterium]|nr:HD domain-containing protein [Betaproteobacteria bacterium]
MSAGLLNSVNEHFMEHVARLSETHRIFAAEDIVDSNGMKLWAAGQEINADLRYKLVVRKLAKPLETCLRVEGGVDLTMLDQAAVQLVEENARLRTLLGPFANATLESMRTLRLHAAVVPLLTAAHENASGTFKHAVLAALLAGGVTLRLGLNALTPTATCAGLLHDLGELYVNPEYLHHQQALGLSEWKQVAAHPRISQVVLEETTDYPRAVALAASEHHEREDGWGYPRHLRGGAISAAGKIIAVAELLSALLARDNPGARASLALRLVPGEFDPRLVSLMSDFAHSSQERQSLGGELAEAVDRSRATLTRLDQATAVCEEMSVRLPPVCLLLHDEAANRLRTLSHAIDRTGIRLCLDRPEDYFGVGCDDARLELDASIKETAWRLRDLARDLDWRASDLGGAAPEAFAKLSEVLHG